MKKILISALLLMSAVAQAGGSGPKEAMGSAPIVPVSAAGSKTAGKAPVAGAISLAALIPTLPAGTQVVLINRQQATIGEFKNKQVTPVGQGQDRTATAVVTVTEGVQIRYPVAQPVVISKPQAATDIWVLPNPQVVTTPAPVATLKPATPAPAPRTPVTVTPVTPVPGSTDALLTICHRTSSSTNPYTVLKLATSQLTQNPNPDDVLYTADGRWITLADWTADMALASVPVSGCPVTVLTELFPGTEPAPTDPVVTPAPETVTSNLLTVCHRTASTTNPYTLLKITVDQVATRTNQTDLVYTADGRWIRISEWTPEAGITLVTLDQCPTTVIEVTPLEPAPTEPVPTEPVPAPVPNPTPAPTDPVVPQPTPVPTPPVPDGTVNVCHPTGSATNPRTIIKTTPDKMKPGDVLANPDGTCPPPPAPAPAPQPQPAPTDPVNPQPAPSPLPQPAPTPTPTPTPPSTDGMITVCHPTGSATNPWTIIKTTPDKMKPGDVPANPDGTCPAPPAR